MNCEAVREFVDAGMDLSVDISDHLMICDSCMRLVITYSLSTPPSVGPHVEFNHRVAVLATNSVSARMPSRPATSTVTATAVLGSVLAFLLVSGFGSVDVWSAEAWSSWSSLALLAVVAQTAVLTIWLVERPSACICTPAASWDRRC